ncbi:LRR receptor-like serine threonine-protein kinase [Seminavis robusta]|uniref:LRR receptor-like serine threonine-protein kinase n=1 Tax=Seminavis robusta TaxID=568900 RepID=A0A9N8EZK9_9STRA|nr:LRR receptor-like serine threonine-protein kinase [Seminavis robusta]|eukprot:Sro2239_g320230.1 LRR receptor-like serine threonine-protein kinase (491) ;mRNA; f:8034-10001
MDHTINSTGIDADADADNHTEHKKKSPPDTGTGSDNYDPSKESMTVATSSTKVQPELSNSNLFASDHTAEFPLPEPLPEPLLSPNNYLPHQSSNNVGAHAIPGFGLVGAYAVQGIGRETEESKQQNDAQPHPQVPTPDEESGLVQAQPVQDEPIRMTAQPVYQQEQQQQPNGRQRFLIIGIPLIILLVCVVVGVSLAVGLAKNGNKDTSLQVPDDTTGEFVDLALGNVDLSLSAIQPIHIPPEISMLTGLLYLHLYENEIHGNIMEILPTQLFQMTSLLEIGLRKNALTGQIPSELGLLTRLYLVELAGNKLTGRIPSELGATVILTFKVCCNQLTGSLPNELLAPGLANMDEFNVQHNMLTGTIPSEIWTSWTKLVVLQLGDNLFSGQGIPTQLNGSHSLPDLVELDLSHLPLLTGSLPTFELANLATNFNLSIIEMDKSPGLLGEIPEELCFLQDPTCSFEFWWWPTPRNCSLTFECTPNLCGCDCLC